MTMATAGSSPYRRKDEAMNKMQAFTLSWMFLAVAVSVSYALVNIWMTIVDGIAAIF